MRTIRPELQGLRAIAVGLVLAYHLWPGQVGGGYVGVDVFFVLSGFLITSHLARETAEQGRLRLREFWARRVRRLLPAASIVLIACFALMLALVPPSLWQRTVTEIAASALYAQNWLLVGNAVDYLGAENVPTLVQHYWSLAVEEQFYLLWPLLFLWFRRIRVAVVLVLVLSFAYALVATDAGVYFNTGTRAWEFAAGALLALVPPLRLPAIAGWAGLALILWSGFTTTGYTALGMAVPVLGTLLVISAGERGAGRLLSWRPLSFIGDNSYALYLWHWPLIVVAPFVFGTLTLPVALGIVVASMLLAILTTRLVERPLRAWLINRRTFAYAAAAVGVIVVVSTAGLGMLAASSAAAERQSIAAFASDPCYGAAALADADCPAPFRAPDRTASVFAPTDKGTLAEPCDSKGVELRLCEFGETENPVLTVALIGNSHADALTEGFEAYGQEHGWRVTLFSKRGCVGASTAPATTEYDPECTAWTREVLEAAKDFDVVVFATNNDSAKYLGPKDADADLISANVSENLAALVAAGAAVFALGDVPATDQPAPACVDQRHLDYDPCATPRAAGEEHGNLVAEAARTVPGVFFESLLPYFCDAELCHVVIGGVVVYIDEHHLSASFSRSLGPFLGAAIQSQLERRSPG